MGCGFARFAAILGPKRRVVSWLSAPRAMPPPRGWLASIGAGRWISFSGMPHDRAVALGRSRVLVTRGSGFSVGGLLNNLMPKAETLSRSLLARPLSVMPSRTGTRSWHLARHRTLRSWGHLPRYLNAEIPLGYVSIAPAHKAEWLQLRGSVAHETSPNTAWSVFDSCNVFSLVNYR